MPEKLVKFGCMYSSRLYARVYYIYVPLYATSAPSCFDHIGLGLRYLQLENSGTFHAIADNANTVTNTYWHRNRLDVFDIELIAA